jgi:hypothetical protein
VIEGLDEKLSAYFHQNCLLASGLGTRAERARAAPRLRNPAALQANARALRRIVLNNVSSV